MSDKLDKDNELNAELDALNENEEAAVENETAEAEELAPPKPKFEENDNWEFEAEALTLKDTLISNDEMEIEIPEKKSESYETRERPKAEKKEKETKEDKPKDDGKNATKFIITGIIAVIVIGVLTFFGIRYYSVPNTTEIMNPGNVAVTVGDTDVSLGMYNYYYNSVVQNYVQQAQYGTIDLDVTAPYEKQETTDDDGNPITWADKFKEDTIFQLQQVIAFYEKGVEAGTTITEEDQKQIDEYVAGIESGAEQSDVSVDEYVSLNYGDYCGLATIKKMLNMTFIAQYYLQQQIIDLKPTDEQVQAYFDEHQDDIYYMPSAFIVIPYEEDTKEDVIAKATAYAKNISSVDDMKAIIPEACADIINSYVESGYYSSAEDVAKEMADAVEINITKSDTTYPAEMTDWLFADTTKAGDCAVFESDEHMVEFIVLKTGEKALDEEEVFTVRHILVQAKGQETTTTDEETGEEKTTTAEPTEEDWAEAEKKAADILIEYKAGDADEKSFAALAQEYSDDTASVASSSGAYGGLYSNVAKGETVEPFENWAFDEARQYGDTGIVKTEYGYHVMFFVDRCPRYLAGCKTAVVYEMQDEFIDSYKVKEHKLTLKKATVAKPTAESAVGSGDAQGSAAGSGNAQGSAAGDVAATTDVAAATDVSGDEGE